MTFPLLHRRIADAIKAGQVVNIVTDFDGTLSEFVPDPESATPSPDAVLALKRLSAIDGVKVALCTGRPLSFVERFFGREVDIYASYGAETRVDGVLGGVDLEIWQTSLDRFAERISEAFVRNGGKVFTSARLAQEFDGLYLERKPGAVALHDGPARTGNPDSKVPTLRQRAIDMLAGGYEGLTTSRRPNSGNVEFEVPTRIDKGVVIRGLEGFVVFSGDDVKDINAALAVREGDGAVLVVNNRGDSVRQGTPAGLLELADEVFESPVELGRYYDGLAREITRSLGTDLV